MVIISDERALAEAEFQLVRTDTGNVLLTRRLRGVDADQFNRQWTERGIPTRWERALDAVSA